MGDESTATRRLNLAQAFNPMGSIFGMFVASMFILINLDGTTRKRPPRDEGRSEGTPVHTQMVGQQVDAVKTLLDVIDKPGSESKKTLLKKAMEESSALSSESRRCWPIRKPDQAKEIDEQIAAQPKQNKFAAAINAVAIVMQVREPVQPTEAEARRDELFHGGGGSNSPRCSARSRRCWRAIPASPARSRNWPPRLRTPTRLSDHFARSL